MTALLAGAFSQPGNGDGVLQVGVRRAIPGDHRTRIHEDHAVCSRTSFLLVKSDARYLSRFAATSVAVVTEGKGRRKAGPVCGHSWPQVARATRESTQPGQALIAQAGPLHLPAAT